MYPRTTLLHSRRHALSASPLRRFPNEVLGAAFSFLHRRDLTCVVRVCRCFHVEGQIYLYRSVELSNESPNVQETITLLRTLPVGAYVREVALITTSSHTPTWFSPNIVQNWVNLRRLELSGIPFAGQDIGVFHANLQEHCRGLQSLVYRHDACLDFPGDGSGLFGERRGRRGHSIDSHFSNANKPAQSLTHIIFAGRVVHCLGSSFDTFVRLRFPNLRSLELGMLGVSLESVPYPTTFTAVTRFLVEHNTIEHLSLSKRVPRHGFFNLDRSLIAADFLPKLQSFEGCPPTLTILARRGVRSIFSLASISLFSSGENLYDIFAMIHTIQSSAMKAMTSVQDLRVVFPRNVNPQMTGEGVHAMFSSVMAIRQRSCLDEMAEVFPNLVNFWVNFTAMDAYHFNAMFGLYPSLKTITVPWYTLRVHREPSWEIQYFSRLVESLPSLNTVAVRRPRYTNLKDEVFTLVRNPNGELSNVLRKEVRLPPSFSWVR